MNPDLFQHRGPERSPSARDWRAARLEALSLADHKANWDGEGALAVPKKLIDSTISFFKELERVGQPAPDSVYPLAIGAAMAEWHYADQTVVSAEIREPGKAEVLVWHPARLAVFKILSWNESPAKPYRRASGPNKRAWEAVSHYLADHGATPQEVTDPPEVPSPVMEGVGRAEAMKAFGEAMTTTDGFHRTSYQQDAGSEEQYCDGGNFTLDGGNFTLAA